MQAKVRGQEEPALLTSRSLDQARSGPLLGGETKYQEEDFGGKMMHSPQAGPRGPANLNVAAMEEQLMKDYKNMRRMQQKMNSIRVSVLRAMTNEHSVEAAEILRESPRALGAVRCGQCPGCRVWKEESVCGKCRPCHNHGGCIEQSRLCFDWTRTAVTFQATSIVSGVSSNFDLAKMDLSKYQELMERVREAFIDLEIAVDDLPDHSTLKHNARFNKTRRDKELADEEGNLSLIVDLLKRHGELTERMTEVDDAPGLPEIGSETPRGEDVTVLSRTQTARGLQSILPLPGDWGADGTIPSWLRQVDSQEKAEEEQQHLGVKELGAALLDNMSFTDLGQDLAGKVVDLTRMEEEPKDARGDSVKTAVADVILGDQRESRRRRSSSDPEGMEAGRRQAHHSSLEAARERLFTIKNLVETRSRGVSQALIRLETSVTSTEGRKSTSMTWVKAELESIQSRLEKLEAVESEAWNLTGRTSGSAARSTRAKNWSLWLEKVEDKIAQIKEVSWKSPEELTSPRTATTTACRSQTGHVEKVRLPVFNGQVEDYGDFKAQFRQLCSGEKYPEVIELAQLRAKLPREGVAAIAGLEEVAEAWRRLDEIFGNKKVCLISALGKLRAFKSTKSNSHDRVLELVTAVQKCRTTMKTLGAEREFFADRDTIAAVILALPADSRGHWYRLQEPEDETEEAKGRRLVEWLERERRAAVSSISTSCLPS